MTPKTRGEIQMMRQNIITALERVVEAYSHINNPFHNPISSDARLAIRELKWVFAEALAEPAPRRLTLTNVDLLDMWKDATYKAMREDEGEAHEFYARAIEARIFGDVK
jgi:formiminotetrahydrofolate cyclodeaminase